MRWFDWWLTGCMIMIAIMGGLSGWSFTDGDLVGGFGFAAFAALMIARTMQGHRAYRNR